jgi:hypothetical protein
LPQVVRTLSDKKEIDGLMIGIYRALSANDSQASVEADKIRRELRVNANRVIWSPDKKSLIAYFKDETTLTSQVAWLVDATSWSVIAEVPVDDSILYAKWTPGSERAVIIERKFLRNSLSPWNFLSSLLGHSVGIYRYSMLVIDAATPGLQRRTEIVEGAYHSVGFAWRKHQ